MPQIDPIMLECARLRAHGRSWAECAKIVPRASETMRSWPHKRADEWRIALVTAIDEALGTLENEALLVCRKHLRMPDKPTARDKYLSQVAARDLLRHARELRGIRMKHEVSGVGGGPLEVFHHMSIDDLAAIAAAGEDEEGEGEHAADSPESG